jgi:penicillin-binding protein 1A
VRHAAPQPVRASSRRRRSRWLRRFVGLIVILAVAALAGYLYILTVYAPGLRSEARLIPASVRFQLSQHNAHYAVLGDISPNLQHAIVAIEDRRFYYHPGIDPIGMIRAAWVNLSARKVDQGGSTLEEQLVKRSLVPDDGTIHAKLRHIALAWAVDQEFSKRTILELYLNAAYYGQGAYGAGAAARIYFGTDSAHLTLAQAAFLAALPQAPSIYGANPTSAAVRYREHRVLDGMVADNYITAEQEQAALAEPLHFAFPNP